MEKSKWKLLNLQLVIVFRELNNNFKEIPQLLDNSFDGQAMLLPIPDDAPKEIPRVTISSSDNFSIEVSKERLTISFEDKGKHDNLGENISDLKEKLRSVFEKLSIKVDWIGLILRNINENETANDNVKKLLNGDHIIFDLSNSDSDLLIRFHKKLSLDINQNTYSGDMNIELGSSLRRTDNDKQIGNFFMLDINTRKTHDPYDLSVINNFIDQVITEQNNHLSKLPSAEAE